MQSIVLLCAVSLSHSSYAQFRDGKLEGRVADASNLRPLYGVKVVETLTGKFSVTGPDGRFSLELSPGIKTVQYICNNFQSKIIRHIMVYEGMPTEVNSLLLPLILNGDSSRHSKLDTLIDISLDDEKKFESQQKDLLNVEGASLKALDIASGKDAEALLRQLPGVSIRSQNLINPAASILVKGMGNRYNQLLIDGIGYINTGQFAKAFLVKVLPIEMIDNVAVYNHPGDISVQGFSASVINIKTKDLPRNNFLLIKAGLNYYDKSIGEHFFSEKANAGQFFSFPGEQRSLPATFPTTRSRFSLDQKNIQEQVFLSKQLKNNLGVVSSNSAPNTAFSIAGGRTLHFKKGNKAGIYGYIASEKQEQVNEVAVSAVPDIVGNPFPFDQDKLLIKSMSRNSSYSYFSFLTAGINAALYFGKNKVVLKGRAVNSFNNTYTQRSEVEKWDEDSLANSAVNFVTEQRRFYMLHLSGEHSLGQKSMLQFTWNAAYSFLKQENPDERNFLLRQSQSNTDQFEIASLAGVANAITNTYRMWRTLRENYFVGSFGLSIPFKTGRVTNLLSGGACIETKYREFFSDIYIVKGTGYASLGNLLAPERYYPGGLSVVNYYSNQPSYLNLNDRGNYIGSVNLSSSFLKLENQVTKNFHAVFSLRAESNNQLVSSTQYNYFSGFRFPQVTTTDQNVTVSKLSVLPAITVKFTPIQSFVLRGEFFRSVNRAQVEELSLNRYFDASSFLVNTGNQYLRNSSINNFQASANFNTGASVFFVQAFYKTIDQPIEYVVTPYTQSTLLSMPYNLPEATVKGVTGSINVNIGKALNASWQHAFNFFAKATWLKTNVKGGPIKSNQFPFIEAHDLSGSPAFSANAGFSFHVKHYPLLSVTYSRTGDYLSHVGSGSSQKLGNGNQVLSTPHYRVKGNNILDIHISQAVFHSALMLAAGVNNLLGEKYTEYQDLNGNKKFDEALLVTEKNGRRGYYQSGIDNALKQLKTQRNIYFSISYQFNKP